MLKKLTKKKETLSDAAIEMVAARFRVLGDPTRLKLVQLLFNGEQSVLEICRLMEMSQANISKHLSILSEQGVLKRRKEGLFVYYSIGDETLVDICGMVCKSLSDRFNQVQRDLRIVKDRKAR